MISIPHGMAIVLTLGLCCSSHGAFAQELSSPRQLLATVDIDDSVFEILQTADLDDPTTGDISALDHIASTLLRFDLTDVEHWAKPISLPVENLSTGSLYQIEGVVVSVESIVTPSDGTVFRSLVRLSPSQHVKDAISISVWSKQVPNSWKPHLNSALEITARCQGLLVKTDVPTFVAARFEWLPRQGDVGPTAPRHLNKVAELGIDVSLFETLEHGKKLTSTDRECFYQMLSHAEQLTRPGEHGLDVADTFNIVDLLRKPREQTGRAYDINGIARRAIRIPVNDADIQARFGIDHYYEVDVFVLMEPTLILVDEESGEKTSYHKFPMTFCVRTLPSGFPEGPVINQPVSVHGVYFKLWAYRNELLSQSQSRSGGTTPNRRQQSPLFVAYTPKMRQIPNDAVRQWNATSQWIGLAFALSVVIAAAIIYTVARRNNAIQRQRSHSGPVTIDLPE